MSVLVLDSLNETSLDSLFDVGMNSLDCLELKKNSMDFSYCYF